MKLVNPIVAIIGAIGCIVLAAKLDFIVWQVYSVTCPLGLLFYFLYGRSHSRLANSGNGSGS